MKLDEHQLAFMARLSKTPEGRFLAETYQAELRELDVKLRKATGDDIYRLQGRAQQLEEMIERITNTKPATARPPTRFNASQGFGT